MRDRCGNCNRRAKTKTYTNVVGVDGLYTEERCAFCGVVLFFQQILHLDAKTAAQIVALGAAEPWKHPGRSL